MNCGTFEESFSFRALKSIQSVITGLKILKTMRLEDRIRDFGLSLRWNRELNPDDVHGGE